MVLYHFDEVRGAEAHGACGDEELTLRALLPLWSSRPGFGETAGFTRYTDDANIFVGPTNNDKLELRTCTNTICVRPGQITTASLPVANIKD